MNPTPVHLGSGTMPTMLADEQQRLVYQQRPEATYLLSRQHQQQMNYHHLQEQTYYQQVQQQMNYQEQHRSYQQQLQPTLLQPNYQEQHRSYQWQLQPTQLQLEQQEVAIFMSTPVITHECKSRNSHVFVGETNPQGGACSFCPSKTMQLPATSAEENASNNLPTLKDRETQLWVEAGLECYNMFKAQSESGLQGDTPLELDLQAKQESTDVLKDWSQNVPADLKLDANFGMEQDQWQEDTWLETFTWEDDLAWLNRCIGADEKTQNNLSRAFDVNPQTSQEFQFQDWEESNGAVMPASSIEIQGESINNTQTIGLRISPVLEATSDCNGNPIPTIPKPIHIDPETYLCLHQTPLQFSVTNPQDTKGIPALETEESGESVYSSEQHKAGSVSKESDTNATKGSACSSGGYRIDSISAKDCREKSRTSLKKRPYFSTLPIDAHRAGMNNKSVYQEQSKALSQYGCIDPLIQEKNHIYRSMLGYASIRLFHGLEETLNHIVSVHQRCLDGRKPFHIHLKCASMDTTTAPECCWMQQLGSICPDSLTILRSFRQMCTQVVNLAARNSSSRKKLVGFPKWVNEDLEEFLRSNPPQGRGEHILKKDKVEKFAESLGIEPSQVLSKMKKFKSKTKLLQREGKDENRLAQN